MKRSHDTPYEPPQLGQELFRTGGIDGGFVDAAGLVDSTTGENIELLYFFNLATYAAGASFNVSFPLAHPLNNPGSFGVQQINPALVHGFHQGLATPPGFHGEKRYVFQTASPSFYPDANTVGRAFAIKQGGVAVGAMFREIVAVDGNGLPTTVREHVYTTTSFVHMGRNMALTLFDLLGASYDGLQFRLHCYALGNAGDCVDVTFDISTFS